MRLIVGYILILGIEKTLKLISDCFNEWLFLQQLCTSIVFGSWLIKKKSIKMK